MGVSVRGAADLAPQALQALVDDLHASAPRGDWAILKVDLRNAFNTIWRIKVQQALSQRCPEALAWFHTCYVTASPLVLGNNFLWSRSGVQQGDPLGPAFFAIGMQDVLDYFATCTHLWQSWYLDDGILVGPVPILAHCLDYLQGLATTHVSP
jgi:hypothetical protein